MQQQGRGENTLYRGNIFTSHPFHSLFQLVLQMDSRTLLAHMQLSWILVYLFKVLLWVSINGAFLVSTLLNVMLRLKFKRGNSL